MNFRTSILGNTLASLPRTTRGNPIVLGGDPKGKNFLYCNNNSVIIRNIDVRVIFELSSWLVLSSCLDYTVHIFVIFQDPSISDIYTEHSVPVVVAKYSPSGFYIASGGMSCSYIKYFLELASLNAFMMIYIGNSQIILEGWEFGILLIRSTFLKMNLLHSSDQLKTFHGQLIVREWLPWVRGERSVL